jgi:Tol biopolymer transport system component
VLRPHRLHVATGVVEDLSDSLETAYGQEVTGLVGVSPDGSWLVMESETAHSDCRGWACYVVAPADLTSLEVVSSLDGVVHGEGLAIAPQGAAIVVGGSDHNHDLDLYLIERDGEDWTGSLLLTGGSPHTYNSSPRWSSDGTKVLFDCGPQPYAAQRTAICEVDVTTKTVTELIAPDAHPTLGYDTAALHGPDYTPDGKGIVFEADWDGEQIWTWDRASDTFTLVAPAFSNDNTPCILPDGSMVSLWLERPEGDGKHELKRVAPDGTFQMLLTDLDIHDDTLGCAPEAP